MINELEEFLKQLLIRELPIKNGEVSIEFDQPKREWSSRLSRPTINVFLYDLRENNILRQPEWNVDRGRETATKRRSAARIDLNYMITAWASEAEDEHRLLARTLMALLRNPLIAVEDLPENLRGQPVPIPLTIASHEALQNVADIWGVLDNEIRPAVALTMTVALNPYQPVTGPAVRTRELRFGTALDARRQRMLPGSPPDAIWQIGGWLVSDRPLEEIRMTLAERGENIPVAPDGQFKIGNLEEGEYNLEISVAGGHPSRHPLKVPSHTYEIKV